MSGPVHEFRCLKPDCGISFRFALPAKAPRCLDDGTTIPGDPLPSCPSCGRPYVRDLTLASETKGTRQ